MTKDLRSAWHHDPRIKLTASRAARLFLERGGCCRECGRKLGPGDDWIVEHVIALENGGTNDFDNLGITGKCCKAEKDARDHAQAGKQRRTSAKHLVSKSMRPKSRLSKPKGTKYDWAQGRYRKDYGNE